MTWTVNHAEDWQQIFLCCFLYLILTRNDIFEKSLCMPSVTTWMIRILFLSTFVVCSPSNFDDRISHQTSLQNLPPITDFLVCNSYNMWLTQLVKTFFKTTSFVTSCAIDTCFLTTYLSVLLIYTLICIFASSIYQYPFYRDLKNRHCKQY